MATRITDILIPELWVPYLREATKENSRLFQSGAIADDATIDAEIAKGGNTVHIPFWQDLGSDGTKPNVQGDDPTSRATPGKIEADEQIGVVLRRTVAFGSADISASLAGSDPIQVAIDRIAPYWDRQLNATAIAVLKGALGAIDIESGGVGIYDVSVASGTPVYIDAEVVIDARTDGLGDAADDLTLMFVHSKVYGRLQKQNLIDFIPDSRGEVVIPTYLGMRLIPSDTMPVNLAGGNPVYDSFIVGPGALRYGETAAKVPVAIDRDELGADGAGVEYMVSRRNVVIHPFGFKFSGSTPPAGPTDAALATPANWTRAYERKNIPVVGVRTNG